MISQLYLSDRLAADPELSQSKKGRLQVKVLLQSELIRNDGKSGFQAENVTLPVIFFSYEAEAVQSLVCGDLITIGAHLQNWRCHRPRIKSGSRFAEEIRHFAKFAVCRHARSPFPADSILADYVSLARKITERADCYIIGSILPVVAALLGRAVWFPWCGKRLYPNLFSMVVGKPGDRKSSTIDLAEIIARSSLPKEAFLPLAFSPETLFDEYDQDVGGRTDKLWLVDDANPILSDWQNDTNGERNAARFLRLYDGKDLSESYRRNREKNNPESQRRLIPETSTSLVFGSLQLQANTIQLAIAHVETCHLAAQALEAISRRAVIASEAELLLERIRADFCSRAKNGAIILTRSELTRAYASHGRRDNRVEELRRHLIPRLI